VRKRSSFVVQRGNAALVLLTNQQTNSHMHRRVKTSFAAGTVLYNVFWPTVDFVTVDSTGHVNVYLDYGESKMYLPQ
jgi:hypothetical protein